MRFCPDCDNILFPKNNKLFCRACKKEFELDPKTKDYRIVKIIKHNENEFEPIIVRKTVKNIKYPIKIEKDSKNFFN
jgi:DNA-directed RNA polymerase subunit M/transcription elongation factor TFIIS